MSRSFSVLALCAVFSLLTLPSLPAEEKSKPKEPPKPAAAKQPLLGVGKAAIKEALAKPTEMTFIEAPLSEVIDYLKGHHRIEIQLDKRALSDVGIEADSPITTNLRGVSLRSALKLLLRELNLTWTIQDEVLLITTPEEAEMRLTTKVIDVSDLVVCLDEDDEDWDDYTTLIDAITTSSSPTTWDDVGGPGSITGASLSTAKVLIVSQTREVHEEVAKLLADIREIAKKYADEDPPLRDRPQSESAMIQPGSHQRIVKLLEYVHAIAKEFPEKEQSPTSEPAKKPGAMFGGTGTF